MIDYKIYLSNYSLCQKIKKKYDRNKNNIDAYIKN
jgi:hypothetical protein